MDKFNFFIFTDISLEPQEEKTDQENSSKPDIVLAVFKHFLESSKFGHLPTIIDKYTNMIKILGHEGVTKEIKEELLKIYHRNTGATTRKVDEILSCPMMTQDYITFFIGDKNFVELANKLKSRLHREYNVPE